MKGEKFKKEERLRRKTLFGKVLQDGKWFTTKGFAICYLEAGEKKVGFTVVKRVNLKPSRNFVKRRLRELYRKNHSIFPEKGYWVFMGQEATATLPFRELETALKKILVRLKTHLHNSVTHLQ